MAGLRQLLSASDYLQEYDLFEICEEQPHPNIPSDKSRESVSGLATLAKTIETEIVPRLMLAHRAELKREEPRVQQTADLNHHEVAEFATIVVKDDAAAARRFVDALLARSIPIESIFLDLMAPAARHLGDLWLDDRLDFMSVTLGLSRLQQLLRILSSEIDADRRVVDHDKRVLLVTIPGEQHTFGMFMVAEFFRRGGWDVWGGVPEGHDSVLELLAADWFDIVGLSVSLEGNLARLGRFIQQIRESSRNVHLAVMIGGRAIAGNAELARELGADAIAADGRQAVSQAQEILGSFDRRLS